MKKILKIFTVLIITFVLFLALDICFFYKARAYEYDSAKPILEQFKDKTIELPHYFIKLIPFKEEYKNAKQNFRPVMNEGKNERPIAIFGCSFAYGHIFDNEETISYVMSKYFNRPIFNRAISGWSIQHMLFQLREDSEIYNEIKAPKYVFYVLMSDHFRRMHYTNFPSLTSDVYYLTYKLKEGELVERKPLFNKYYTFALTRHFYNKIQERKVNKVLNNDKFNEELSSFFVLHIKNINDLIVKNWGEDTKFIILTFQETNNEYWQKDVEQMGIDVVDISTVLGINELEHPKWGFYDKKIAGHPKAKLWEMLVPKLKEMYPDL